MTSNQIAYKEAKIKEAEAKEKQRSNKAREKLESSAQDVAKRGQNIKAATDVLGNIVKVGTANDKSWYNGDPQLVKDVASISFNNPLGNKVPNMFEKVTGLNGAVPGIMVLRWMPSLGALAQNGVASTADIAAKSLYSYVRYANSGARNYESVDLMMYLLATTEAYSYYSFMARLYSLITTSKAQNRYYVNAMVNANGVDADNLRDNIANFRAYINSYAVRLNSLYIPKDLPYMLRHNWMNANIFKDSNIKKSQEYMYLQKDFLKYDDINGKLVVFPASVKSTEYGNYAYDFGPNKRFTFAQLKNTGDLIINQLVQSEDAGIMGGDILKAYGESQMAYAATISEDFHIESVYNYEVLTQIHNAIFLNIPSTGLTAETRLHLFDIGQITINTSDYLTQGLPYFNSSEAATGGTDIAGYAIPTTMGLTQQDFTATKPDTENSILNFDMDEVSPDDVMVATRLQPVVVADKYFTFGDPGTGSIQMGAATSFGTEIPIDFAVVSARDSIDTLRVVEGLSTYLYVDNAVDKTIECLSDIINFDWHPRVAPVATGMTSSTRFGYSSMANYTTISNSVKDNLHYVAVLSELGIPKLGLTVRNR